MFFLEQTNRIVYDTLLNGFKTPPQTDVESKEDEEVIQSDVCDMDDAQMHIVIKSSSASVSIKVPYFDVIKDKGAMDSINAAYPEFVQATPEEDFNVTITATREQWTGKEEEVAKKFALLRRNLVAGIFEKYVRATKAETLSSLAPVEYRSTDDTLITFTINEKQLLITFALDFIDKADREIVRIFMTELVNASRKNPRAPNMVFKPEILPERPNYVGTFTFIVVPHNGEERILASTADLISSFRNFLHYHIKSSKSHFHSKMRNRVVDLVKILNRAKT